MSEDDGTARLDEYMQTTVLPRDYSKMLEDIARDVGEMVKKIEAFTKESRDVERIKELVKKDKKRVNPEEPDLEIYGVDGGEGYRIYQSVVMYLVRAVAWASNDAVLTTWRYGILTRTRTPRLRIAALRTILEAGIAASAASENPDWIMIDGPIVPHHDLRGANEDSPTKRNYWGQVISSRVDMLERCEDEGVKIVGVIEDCNSRHLIRFLEAQGLAKGRPRLRDVAVLADTSVLDEGERTSAFVPPYGDYPVFRIIEEESGYRIKVMYLRTTREGPPLRVEIPDFIDPDEAASVVFSTAVDYNGYGIPIHLVMADAFTKVEEGILDWIEDNIRKELIRRGREDILTTVFKRLRRESRPRPLASKTVEADIKRRHGG